MAIYPRARGLKTGTDEIINATWWVNFEDVIFVLRFEGNNEIYFNDLVRWTIKVYRKDYSITIEIEDDKTKKRILELLNPTIFFRHESSDNLY